METGSARASWDHKSAPTSAIFYLFSTGLAGFFKINAFSKTCGCQNFRERPWKCPECLLKLCGLAPRTMLCFSGVPARTPAGTRKPWFKAVFGSHRWISINFSVFLCWILKKHQELSMHHKILSLSNWETSLKSPPVETLTLSDICICIAIFIWVFFKMIGNDWLQLLNITAANQTAFYLHKNNCK